MRVFAFFGLLLWPLFDKRHVSKLAKCQLRKSNFMYFNTHNNQPAADDFEKMMNHYVFSVLIY